MLLDVEESQLVLVDFQPKLQAVMHDAANVWANAVRLVQAAGLLDVPVWGTEQNPSKLGAMPPELRSACQRVLAKMQFSAVEEGLGEWLTPTTRRAARQRPQPASPPAKAASRSGRAQIHRVGWGGGACVPAADGVGPAGRRV